MDEPEKPPHFNPDPNGNVWVIAHVTWFDPETGDWRNFEASGIAADNSPETTANTKKITVNISIGENSFKFDRSGNGRPYSGT